VAHAPPANRVIHPLSLCCSQEEWLATITPDDVKIAQGCIKGEVVVAAWCERSTKHPDDLNAVSNRQIENQIVANGETAKVWQKFVSTCADVGKLRESCAPFVNAIKQPVSSVRALLGDMPPDIIKVSFGLWAFEHLGHED